MASRSLATFYSAMATPSLATFFSGMASSSLAVGDYMNTVACRFNWGDLAEDVVMDVGCGKEKYLCHMLMSLYLSVKKVIAIDIDGVLVNELQREADAQGKIEYHCADIQNKNSLERWLGGISKVISMNCFHLVTKQKEAFKNVYDLLKPGGEAGIMYCIDAGFYRWCPEMLAHPKYKQYYKCKRKMYPEFIETDRVHATLGMTGFIILVCNEAESPIRYDSDATCKDGIFASFINATHDLGSESFDVPQDMLEEFKNELFRVFLKYNPRNKDGKPWDKCTMLKIFVKKPS